MKLSDILKKHCLAAVYKIIGPVIAYDEFTQFPDNTVYSASGRDDTVIAWTFKGLPCNS